MPATVSARPPLLSRALGLYLLVAFGAMVSFYLLLSVVPLYATSAGTNGIGAGLTTGALMFATVAAELGTPALLARFGYRLVLAAGMVLLGAPALVLAVTSSLPAILAVSLVRGVGLAIAVVAGSSLVATLAPRERRSEALGLLGVVVGIPAVVALPLGVWLSERVGFPPVFVAGALAALVCLVVMPALPGRTAGSSPPLGVLAGLRAPAQIRPAMAFLLTAMGAGIVVTFLPLATRGSGGLAAPALFANATAATLARWGAGRYGGRHGQSGLLVLGVVACAAGMLALAFGAGPAPVAAGAVLLGLGFGVAQNASLTLMFERVSPSGYDMVSAVWNLAYDAGLGLGAAGFGVVAARGGYVGAFGITAALMLAALAPVWRDRAWLVPAADDRRAAQIRTEGDHRRHRASSRPDRGSDRSGRE
ncbi:MAG: MFS transporter [Gemmatimonadales bacterium]